MKVTRLFLLIISILTIACNRPIVINSTTELYAVVDGDSLYMDYYRSFHKSENRRPCLIFLFGGGFAFGERDAECYKPLFESMLNIGYDVASIDYRLGMKGYAPESLDGFVGQLSQSITMATMDLYAATGYILSHADERGIDPRKIVVCGSSAGAITALQGEYGICNGLTQGVLPDGFNYAGVISFAGGIMAVGDTLAWSSQPAPILMFHGTADSNVPYDVIGVGGASIFGSGYISSQLDGMSYPHIFHSVDNARHELAITPITQNWAEISLFLNEFVDGGKDDILIRRVGVKSTSERQQPLTVEDFIRSNYPSE